MIVSTPARRVSGIICFLLLAGRGAAAQPRNYDFDLQAFHPALTSGGLITIEGTGIGAHLSPRIALQVGYAYQPLLYEAFDRDIAAVKHRFAGTAILSVGFFNRFEVGVGLPFVFRQTGDAVGDDTEVGASALGGLRVVPKLRLWGRPAAGLSVAVSLGVTAPTASKGTFSGAGPTYEPAILAAYGRGRFVLDASAGYRMRERVRLYSLEIDDQLFAGLGARFAFDEDLSFFGEIVTATAADDPFGDSKTSPLTALVGGRYQLGDFGVMLALGPGLVEGVGTATARVMAVIEYSRGGVDSDGDGVPDRLDRCKLEREDRDGFEDNDGCPDIDNDKDGILDGVDRCPNRAEDKDGFEDNDGCPDIDNDGDGVRDARDSCELKPEDYDGFKDLDGCPDDDNDEDRIPDVKDRCPNEAENYNGIEDADGCPEADRDGDGFLDDVDKCPDEAEDQNGIEDTDGCPDDPDGDRIPTSKDRCPQEPETVNNYQDDDGCPDQVKVKARLDEHVIWSSEAVYFTKNEWKIEKRFWLVLYKIAKVIKRQDRHIKMVYVEGHADQTGGELMNQWLSFMRASAVVRYLTKLGVSRKKLRALGRGMHRPRDPGTTANALAQNRRVRFHVVTKKAWRERVKRGVR